MWEVKATKRECYYNNSSKKYFEIQKILYKYCICENFCFSIRKRNKGLSWNIFGFNLI